MSQGVELNLSEKEDSKIRRPAGWMERAKRSALGPILSGIIKAGNIDPEKDRPQEYRSPSEVPHLRVTEPEVNVEEVVKEQNPGVPSESDINRNGPKRMFR
jgi:hypothetical protein